MVNLSYLTRLHLTFPLFILFIVWSLLIAGCVVAFFGFHLYFIAVLIAWFGGVDFTVLALVYLSKRRRSLTRPVTLEA
jgi:hypothetical protein